jgi:hypothetical protein
LTQKVRSLYSNPPNSNLQFHINKTPNHIAENGDFKYYVQFYGSVCPVLHGSDGDLMHGSTSKEDHEPVVKSENEYLVPGETLYMRSCFGGDPNFKISCRIAGQKHINYPAAMQQH